MQMNTLTLANIYEAQGLKDDALEIYKNILKKDPSNKEVNRAIRRLSGIRKRFAGVDEEMKRFFIQAKEEVELKEFERWLIQWR
jgi:tetratricopeptide (TPR) repeat protein